MSHPSVSLCFLLLASSVALSQNPIAVSACRGEPVTLDAPPGFQLYEWSPSAGIANPQSPTISFAASASATYTVSHEENPGPNLVTNAGFEDGNVDFTSDYRHVPGGTFEQGAYAILTNPSVFNGGFSDCTDPNGGRSNMYVADGATQRGAKAWCQRVVVEPDRRYAFSVSVASLVRASPPRLSFSIDGLRVGTANLPRSTCVWQEFFTVWTAPAGASEVEICIVNDNETPDGNDFALDDISLRPLDPAGRRTTVYEVTVNETGRGTLDTLLCADARYTANGLDLAPGASGVATLQTKAGCDSILTVNTAPAPAIATAAFDTAECRGATVLFEGLSLTRDTVITQRGTTRFGCDSTHVFTLRFFDRTAIVPTVAPPVCRGGSDASVSIAITAGVPPYTYAWSNGATGAAIAGVPAGTYRVSVRDGEGCTAEREIEIVDPPAIQITALAPSPAVCAGEASGGVTYVAEGGTGELSAVALDPAGRRFDPGRLAGGDYVLRVTDAGGCFAERGFNVPSPPPVALALAGDSAVDLGQVVRVGLTATGDSVTARWTFGTASVDSLVSDRVLAFVPTASGLLRVVGSDANGCTEAVTLVVKVRSGRRDYFPTAFSPNGDGVNDVFAAVSSGAIARVERFEVYTRWGGRVFAVEDCAARTATCGWNGRQRNAGDPLDAGVYVYRAVLRLIDGRTITDIAEVHLVR